MINPSNNMIPYFCVTVFMVIFSPFGLVDFGWVNKEDSINHLSIEYDNNFLLSADGRVALHELKNARSFDVSRVGAAGRYSRDYDNFSILLKEKSAKNAFKDLIKFGTKPAKMYGLLGLKFKDPILVEELKPLFINNTSTIDIHGGCSTSNMKISSLLYGKNSINNRFQNESNLRYKSKNLQSTLIHKLDSRAQRKFELPQI